MNESVAICLPAGSEVRTFFAYDLARMMASTASLRPDIQMHILVATGSLVMKQRESLAKAALSEAGITHMLWLDTDMRFPKDTLVRLLAHDTPWVCAGYIERSAPFRPVAFLTPEDWTNRVEATPGSTGLRQIYACGFGVMLTHREMYEKMRRPWFMVGFNHELDGFLGEDVYFCHQANLAGYKLMLDQDLTHEVKHIGTFEFEGHHAIRAREQREAQEVREAEAEQDARKEEHIAADMERTEA
jgi:hypothetical protein